jgi:acyl dehydratase
MLTMGITGRLVTDWLGAGSLTAYGARFVSQVWPGDTLTATATVEAVRDDGGRRYADLSIVTTNQRGEKVLTGTATAHIS